MSDYTPAASAGTLTTAPEADGGGGETVMANMTASRKQRLRTLENNIRKAAEEIQKNGLEIGRDLCEIRDDELWKEEHESWNEYLKERAEELVGKSFSQAARLIQAAEISKRIPEDLSRINATELGPTHLQELGRLAPSVGQGDGKGVEKDYSKLRTQDVKRVLKAATEMAGGEAPSVRDIRKAVDADLGVDRTAKAKETKRQREEESTPELHHFLIDMTGRLEAEVEMLGEVADSADAWKLLRKEHPGVMKRFIAACDSLADLIRRIGR
jgi:hypothetical protein